MVAPHSYQEQASWFTAPRAHGYCPHVHGQGELLKLQPSSHVPGSWGEEAQRKGLPIPFEDSFRVHHPPFHLCLISQSSVTRSRLALSQARKSLLVVGQPCAQLKIGILFVKRKRLMGIGGSWQPLSLHFLPMFQP